MANPVSDYPMFKGVSFETQLVRADSAQSGVNSVAPLTKVVDVQGVVTDANDFIVLPPLSSCPNGHTITVLGNAGSNFEVRTPASSAEEINSEDCDGTKEYLFTNGQVHTFTKINNTIGWMGEGRTAIGAYATAVIPD